MHVKHYILTNDGKVEEFDSDQAYEVANGLRALPRFADRKVRYVQVQFDEDDLHGEDENELQVKTAGAYVWFDKSGVLKEAGSPEEEAITAFEHETCVQLALQSSWPGLVTSH